MCCFWPREILPTLEALCGTSSGYSILYIREILCERLAARPSAKYLTLLKKEVCISLDIGLGMLRDNLTLTVHND